MKKVSIGKLLAGATALTLACGFAQVSNAKDLVMAYSGSLKDPAMICGVQTVAKELAAMVGSEVEMHVGGTGFAAPKKLYAQLARGITDLSVMPLAYTPGRFPMSEIVGLPFAAKNNMSATIAANSLLEEYLADEYKETHPLAVMAIPSYQIHLREAVADISTGLKGKRIRAVGKGLSNTIRGLGADVVGMPIFQVYENMQKGVIDGFVLPNVPLAAFKLHEVSDHHLQADLGVPVLYMGLSKKFYGSLTPEQKKMVDEKYSGVEAAKRYVECFNKQNARSIGLATKKGDTFRDLSADEISAIDAIAQPIIEDYLAGLESKGLPARKFHKAFEDAVKAAGQ